MNPTNSRSHMNEINRLLSTNENVPDIIQALQNRNTSLFSSPLNQSSLGYQSSSSNDSVSPDTFSNIATRLSRTQERENMRMLLETSVLYDNSTPLCETPSSSFQSFRSSRDYPGLLFEKPRPFRQMHEIPESLYESSNLLYENQQSLRNTVAFRREIPILGTKVLDNSTHWQPPSNSRKIISPPNKNSTFDFSTPLWKADNPILYQETSPNMVDQNVSSHKMFYELFPSENKNYEYQKTSQYTNSTNTSPISTNASPISDPTNFSLFTPFNPNYSNINDRVRNIDHNPMFNPRHNSSKTKNEKSLICTFCRKNGETPMVYTTHTVKEKINHKCVVTCPILRSHVCPTCGATGEDAHTITYCPVLRSNNNGLPLQSTTVTLKSTRVKSNGRKRF